ncbi:Increased rDNA silencing protein 4 [Apiospora rasikravindrae]|uniref:Increased rDNA silencing protein 4 n=1 Tax=Apiospora rasikravindrae TaxID=990691 RepID=A0ABR1T5G6_9PEZI
MHHPPSTPTTGRHLPNSPAAAPSSSNNDAAAYAAALRGASLAFQKSSTTTPRPTPKSSPGHTQRQPRATNTKDDGHNDSEALIAATSASRDHSLSRSSPTRAAAGNNNHNNTGRISRQATGSSSIAGEGNYGQENGQNHRANNPPQRSATPQKQQQQQNLYSPNNNNNGGGGLASLKPPGLAPMGPDPRSPSFIAATLAASRSASPSRREQQQPNATQTTHHPYAQQAATRAKRKESSASAGAARKSHSARSSVTDLDLTDTTSIPPTNSLVSMFEKREDVPTTEGDGDPVKKTTTGTEPTKKVPPRMHPITPPLADSPMAKSEASPSMLASTLAWERATSPPASVSGMRVEASPADKLEVKKRNPAPPVKGRKPVGSGAKVPKPEDTEAKRKPRAATPPRPASKSGNSETVILSPRPRRAASHKMIAQPDLVPEGNTDDREGIDRKVLLDESLNLGPRPSSVKTLPAKTTRAVNKPPPPAPRPRRSSSTSSKDTFVSASSAHSPRSGSPHLLPSRVASPRSPAVTVSPRRPDSVQSLPARKPVPPPAPPRRLQAQPNIPLTSLTNATMAGILASSRATPTTASPGPPPLPPPRKQTPHMRQTLRQPSKKSEDEEEKDNRHRHKKHLGKKKHAHHEGARRRWRDQITERERKRYEGVWASNRGLLLSPSSFPVSTTPAAHGATSASASTPNLLLHARRPSYNNRTSSGGITASSGGDATPNPSDFVANVVARDIWSRSRLPFDELAEVWDLVDLRGVGALDKTEFVVGMWLIDQRLRGRKIPQKVSESVWSSARGGTHVRVPAVVGGHKKGKKK